MVRTNGLSKQKTLGIMNSTPFDFHKSSPTHPNFWEKMRETFLWGSVGWFHLWSGFAIITFFKQPWSKRGETLHQPRDNNLSIFRVDKFSHVTLAVLLVDPRRFTKQSNVLWPRDVKTRLPLPKCLVFLETPTKPWKSKKNFPGRWSSFTQSTGFFLWEKKTPCVKCGEFWFITSFFVGECQSLVGGLLYHCYPIIPCCSNLFRDNQKLHLCHQSFGNLSPKEFLGRFYRWINVDPDQVPLSILGAVKSSYIKSVGLAATIWMSLTWSTWSSMKSTWSLLNLYIRKIRSTLQGINISHLGKRKIIFKMPFLGDMLVPWRVTSKFENRHVCSKKKNKAPHFHRLSMAKEAILLWDHDGPAASGLAATTN